MKKVLLSLCIIWLAGVLQAEQINYLVTIDRSSVAETELLQRLDLSIYHISGDILIAGINSLEQLDQVDINYEVIDSNPWSDKYYIVSDKKGEELSLDSSLGRVIYRDRNLILLKTSSLTVEEITSISHSVTELYPNPIRYNFEKIYPSRNARKPVPRTDVDTLLNEINPDSLGYFVQSLEDFGTRYCFAPNRDEVADWIRNEFLRFGYTDVVVDSFYQNNVWHKNIVTTVEGTVSPDEIVIIGGHHDSITSASFSNPSNPAPGADDNATGSGAAMEIARAMKAVNFEPETTIRFITFAAEEVGLWGSHHYAQNAYDNGMNIKLMINNDMIGYTPYGPDNWTINLIEYSGFENEANLARQIIDLYTNITTVTNNYNAANSDSYPFWTRGFPPIFFIETDFNPYYHTVNDLFIHIDMDYAIETVRGSAAIAAMVNAIPSIPEDFIVIDAGNGSELILQWAPVSSTPIEHYEISVGLSSGSYTDYYTTEDTLYTLSGLDEGITYYIGLSAVSINGYESAVIERTGIPGTVPLTPGGFADYPQGSHIELNWLPNLEADLAGYNLYRSDNPEDPGNQLNQALITTEFFNDSDAEPGQYYYYSLTAVDDTGNESEPTEMVRSRLITMDQGVLIVADTSDGNGSFQNPTIDSTTQFYNQILSDYAPDIYPLWEEGEVKLADLGAYSTVIWHKNNGAMNVYDSRTISSIKEFLDCGGNILFSLYFPGNLLGGVNQYPSEFVEGDFIYDYLMIDQVYRNSTARFDAAEPLIDSYPLISVDMDKAPEGLEYHIINIESIRPRTPGTAIYAYSSSFTEGSPGAVMDGMPVGVEYIGTDYKSVILSFPLYYMVEDDARDLINYVMIEKFNETTGIEDDQEHILPGGKNFILYPNHPNPFNPETMIRYTLSVDADIELAIYNIRGQRIRLLDRGLREAGDHSIIWNGKDDTDKEAASGIYFYRLKTDRGNELRKMLLIK